MIMSKREQHECMGEINGLEEQIGRLECVIEEKDIEIAELEEENVKLKKELNESK